MSPPIFKWRHVHLTITQGQYVFPGRIRYLYKKGEFGPMGRQSSGDALELLPVRVELDVSLHKKTRPMPLSVPATQTSAQFGHVELELGEHRLRIHGHVGTAALRSILQALR